MNVVRLPQAKSPPFEMDKRELRDIALRTAFAHVVQARDQLAEAKTDQQRRERLDTLLHIIDHVRIYAEHSGIAP